MQFIQFGARNFARHFDWNGGLVKGELKRATVLVRCPDLRAPGQLLHVAEHKHPRVIGLLRPPACLAHGVGLARRR